MAYANSSAPTRINPLGIATAIGMNALFLYGIASIAPSIGSEAYPETNIVQVIEDKQRVDPPAAQKDQIKPQIQTPIVLPHTNDFVTSPLPPVDLTDRTIIDPPLPPVPLITPLVIPDPLPPPAPAPMVTKASYDTRFASAQQPDYPSAAIRDEVTGFAKVNVRIGADGRVKDVVDIESTRADFFDATRRQAMAHWRFKPATRDGTPIESWREMTVRFQMPKRFD